MVAIKIENLNFCYGNSQTPVLNNFSLEVKQGEFVAIVGRNGSGKSTLARIIDGLLVPSLGTVEVLGMATSDPKNLFAIRSSCGIVFQNPDNQMVASIVEDDVAFGPENVGLSREIIGERIEFALKSTGTENFRRAVSSKLSGGQKQRVAIAGVIALKPKILILDESTSMLDPVSRDEIMNVVKRLIAEENMTVIVITHYMDEVTDCDRVIVIDKGEKVAEGTPLDIFANAEVLYGAGLDLPIPLKIASLLASRGINVGQPLTKRELGEKLCELLRRT